MSTRELVRMLLDACDENHVNVMRTNANRTYGKNCFVELFNYIGIFSPILMPDHIHICHLFVTFS